MSTHASHGGGSAPRGSAAGGGVGGGTVRVIICDGDAASTKSTRDLLETVSGVLILAELTDGGEVSSAIDRYSPDLVLVNLDPTPDKVLPVFARVAERHAGVAFFAISAKNDAVLSAMRSGFREFVKLPEESSRLVDAVGGMRRLSGAEGAIGQVVSVVGSAGGVGCTTLAVNLATELADKCGREVALVDLDFQFGHVAMMLDLDIQYSLADLCGESITLDERLLQKAVMKHKSGVHVVSRPKEFEDTADLSAEACVPVLMTLRKMYPYVVLDGPTRSDPTGRAILDIADWNLLTVQPLVTAARNAKRILAALERMDFDKSRIQVVCNRGGGGLSHLNIQRLEKSLGHKIIISIPDDWMSVSASINLGEPLAMNAPRSKAREAIRELADMICGSDGSAGGDKSSGLLGRLFGRGKDRSSDEAISEETT